MNNYNWNNAFPDTPRSFKNKVSDILNHLPNQKENGEMENRKMYTKVSFKKRITVTLAAIFVLGTTAFAAGKISSLVSGSSNILTYTTIPTEGQVDDDFGFNPKLVEKFDNGYGFANGYTAKTKAFDEQGNCLGKSKDLDFVYAKGDDKVNLEMENGMLGERLEQEVVIDTYNGIDLYFSSDTYKFVPEDYKMTKQDKQDEASGKYVFSCGSKKEEVAQFKYLNWMQDGIYYSFLARDSDLSQDELVEMAHQVINAK
jgi:hypothetical protein